MASTSPTEYLRFSAYSIKDLITKKLAQDSKFTDQVYEGSNLAVLIDIVSYMYQCLMYNVNNAASESMFSDTQIYENISRLVKFIDYHPQGCGPMIASFTLGDDVSESTNLVIPKYAMINTNKTDDNGNPIYYSTTQSYTITPNTDNGNSFQMLMYNGKWQMYSSVFTSNGEAFQKYTLAGLKSDSVEGKDENTTNHCYVPNNMIDVYVYEDNKFQQYKVVNQGLFTDNNITNGVNIYSDEKIVDLRLNEDKTYELTFGNGYNGHIPPKDASIYIFFLNGNGPTGSIVMGEVNGLKLKHSASDLGISDRLYEELFNDVTSYIEPVTELTWTNSTNSSEYVQEESVDDIRQIAPTWFKTGNRVVTQNDFMYYFKNKNQDYIIDALCQNNWEYISTFYNWLYNLGTNGVLLKYGYRKSTTQTLIGHHDHVLLSYDQYLALSAAQELDPTVIYCTSRNPSLSVITHEANHVELSKEEYTQLSVEGKIESDVIYCISNDINDTTYWKYAAGREAINKDDDVIVKSTDKNYYIDQNKLVKYGYKWSDASDSNNVYMWVKMRNDAEILKQIFNKDLNEVKNLTQEVVYLKPIDLMFTPCAETEETAIKYFANGVDFDPTYKNKIEITLDDNCMYSNVDIQQQVKTLIQKFFDEERMTLGQTLDYNDLLNSIYNIGNIARVQTVFYDPVTGETIKKPGLSFASWSNSLIDLGDDLNIQATSTKLQTFQFPKLYNSSDIANRIVVIRKSMNNVNMIQY